ncbi:MAG: PadR family transcriptional regulator [Candidatus Omnitrophota bacterium]
MMIEHEIILLGLLRESPQHGYEIKKRIKKMLFFFAGVDLKSIYYPLRILEKRGLVIKRANKSGKRPERFVYELTSKGENRFTELLTKNFLNFKRPKFSLDLSLYFLSYMKQDIAKRRLRARMRILEKLSLSLNQMIGHLKKGGVSSGVYILEHNLQMLDAESRFLANLIGTL